MDQFLQMLRAAQGGHGMENLARLYGLTPQQAQSAAEAMMPAFAAGVEHAMQSPEAWGALLALMMRGPYAGFYNQGLQSANPGPVGTEALNALFNSPEVAQAVANHAAASTGLGVTLIRQMMPTYGTLFLGGLAKSMAATGAMQQMLAAMIDRLSTPRPRQPQWTGNPWIDAFNRFMGPQPAPAPAVPANPWADAFARMMMANPFLAAATQPAPSPAPRQDAPAGNSWQDVVNAMSKTLAQANPPPRSAADPVQSAALLPFQEFFARMFAQGFPPVGAGGERPRASPWAEQAQAAFYAVPEFWREMFAAANEPRAAKARDRLISGPSPEKDEPTPPLRKG